MSKETFWFTRAALVSVLALGLAACDQEKTYPVTVEEAQAALVKSEIPDIAFGMTAHSEPAISITGGVEWFIRPNQSGSGGFANSANQTNLLILTARLNPVSGGTKVVVDVEPASSAQESAFAKGKAERPAVAALFKSIAREQVDAVLSHRDFDFANIREAMAAATMSMLPQIRNDMKSAGDEFDRRDREKVDEAYRAEADGESTAQDSSSAPTTPTPSR